MRTIEYSNLFKRDFKRESHGQHRAAVQSLLPQVIQALVDDQALAPRLRDHELIGNWKDHRECHIKPDLLLIYKKPDDDTLQLVRLGSHSELFD